jgi:hypothetical protein
MSGAPTPTLIPAPFAVSSGQVNTIPTNAPASPANAASWTEGFPAVVMEPIGSGGLPPLGPDMNGILQAITQALYAFQAGQLWGYNATFAGIIGGYNLGACLAMANGRGIWISTANGNTGNPDANAIDWAPLYYQGTTIVTSTGGTVDLTTTQSAASIIRVQGALTSNVTIIFPAGTSSIQQWLISNETTGSPTVKCQFSSGASVTIAQTGISAPTGIYSPDGANMYATSITTAGLAPLASPAFTGVPTAPTAAAGTNTTQLATCAFVKNAVNPSSNVVAQTGSVTEPSGVIRKWGRASYTGSNPTIINFGTPFPNAFFEANVNGSIGGYQPGVSTSSNASQLVLDCSSLGSAPQTLFWSATGN